MFSGHFEIVNMIKCCRLVILNKYLNDNNLKNKMASLFDYRFKAILDDPKLS